VSLAAVGLAVLVASFQRSLPPVLVLWLVAGVGNGMGTVSYESLLQQHVKDEMRGRVMAASEAVLDGAFLFGAAFAGVLGSALGVRAAFAASGILFVAAGALARAMLGRRAPEAATVPV
jgi:sugar phosphate permease